MSTPATAFTARKRRRHAALRKRYAAARKRVAKRTATVSAKQEAAVLAGRPETAADGFAGAARDLRKLGKELRGDARHDSQVRAASRGVLRTAAAYELLAQATRQTDAAKQGALLEQALKSVHDAEKLQERAGDAWPF